jgi:hypothetical protein
MKAGLFIMIYCLFFAFSLKAQENIGGRPYSFDNVLMERVEVKAMPKLDIISLKAANKERKASGQPLQVGRILDSDLSLDNSGTWTELKNGDRIWRLKIEVPGALATSLYYKNFQLPEGATLYIYSPEKKFLIGGFTSKNNQSNGLFATEIVYSSACILEYYEPAAVKGKGEITVSGIAHVFEAPAFMSTTKSSGSCNVNVNCPEGANWQNQKRAVAKIVFKLGNGQFLCTGTVLNNTAQNDKPYFLTADHCGGTASEADFSQWVFYFNYEAKTCANPSSEPISQTITGSVQRARSGDNGSDFQLLEFTKPIPSSYNVYYAGWNATGTASPSGVGIHHPGGDIKKISTYTSPLADDQGHHWKVYWVRTVTNWGITEGGSSGSAIFDNNGNVVGDLTGGFSSCGVAAQDAWDVYGKFSYSWTSNGTAANRQLKPWLDPTNSGVKVLGGKNQGAVENPTLVDITNASGTIAAQYTDSPAGEEIGKVIDNSAQTKYLTFHNSAWISFRAASSYVVTKYSITSANDAEERDPLSWTLQGSVDGTTWVTLHTQSNQDFPNRFQRREFTFTNTTAYSSYRLNINNNSGTVLQLAEWEIFGTAATNARAIAAESKSVSAESFSIFPNPTRGTLNFSGIPAGVKVQLIDKQGKVIKTWNRLSSNTIDVSDLRAGLYLVKVSGKGIDSVQRLVIE